MANNNRVFEAPFLVRNREDLQQVRSALENLDVFEWARQQRPNSKWIVMYITNATFYVTKLRDHPIGRSTCLPKYVLENPAIVSLDCNKRTGIPYEDKLCFFRCLALHRGCHPHNIILNATLSMLRILMVLHSKNFQTWKNYLN